MHISQFYYTSYLQDTMAQKITLKVLFENVFNQKSKMKRKQRFRAQNMSSGHEN